jgi:hypothetical protein
MTVAVMDTQPEAQAAAALPLLLAVSTETGCSSQLPSAACTEIALPAVHSDSCRANNGSLITGTQAGSSPQAGGEL